MRKALFAAAGLIFLAANPARGQVAWDGPLLVSPETPTGRGVFFVDPSEGSGIGFLGTWRGDGPLGYLIGLAEDGRDEVSVFGGVDVSGRMVDASDDFPLHVSWVAGAGFGAGDDFVRSFPFGISVGRGFQAESVVFSPYLAPRIVLDAHFRDDRPDDRDRDDLNLGLALDLGLDMSPDAGWDIRFGVSVGDRDALAIGVSFRT